MDKRKRGERRERKPRAVRRADGDGEPRRLGSVLRQATGTPTFREGLQVGRLHRSWEEVAGSDLGRRTEPQSLAGGVLVVRCDTAPWAGKARFVAEELRRAANATLGSEAVRAVRVVVAPPERNR